MSVKKPFTVDDAYALETPGDSVCLYGEWAATYDRDFLASSGYVVYRLVAEQLVRQKSHIDGPVLDVGCGTGAVGACLREMGIREVDGIDISEPMLAEAGGKKTMAGDSVYRKLIAADLTQKLDLSGNHYAGLVSAGTFTHGHLGPGALDELWRIAANGAQCAIGIRTSHYHKAGFSGKLAADVAVGLITEPELIEVNMYSAGGNNPEHADDKAYIVVCQVVK